MEILEIKDGKPNIILSDGTYQVKVIKETRTQAQNRLYHKWLNDLIGQLDEKGIFITHDDLHEGLRDKLIPGTYTKNPLTGRRIHKTKTTTKLNKKEFSKYIKDVEKYLWQTFEVSHPLPTDMWYN